ncbi:hypothetical protein M011DRAFT_465650 [Sporormia fimetaria CBS 119925]|uniref:Sulfate transporter n=1 Tax=Sporormia fimetaria CBS 119925 TaxID=1340428 RepID=A0A6A6VHA3_9PLEO|nr:hypothetical protein M011DRAFT_465650 [Sporormia fimetaria CBS 119925]
MAYPISTSLSHLRRVTKHNVQTLKTAPLTELSGSFGDLGTLLPLMTALVLTGSISLTSTLLFTGAANVLTGLAFGIPLPVQPMKAIAAVAIARKFSYEESAAAGLVVASVVGVFSATGLISWANRVTPIPVIKGIQVGAGLSLCISAGTSLLGSLSWTGPCWSDNLLWALAAAAFLLLTLAYPKLPFALIVFTIGLLLSALSLNKLDTSYPDTGRSIPIVHPSGHDFWKATTTAALGQLPLTMLNSVIAVAALASDLLPSPHYPPTPSGTAIGTSVTAVNLIGCWFGAMPSCHGSGGLAAQYRFGARSGSSIIFLGSVKIILGLISFYHPGPILRVLFNIPKSLLGILVLAAGVELAKVGEDLNTSARDLRVRNDWDEFALKAPSEKERKERWMVMLVTVATLLAFKNDAVGFLAGLAWHWGIKVARNIERRREERGLVVAEERTALLSHEESDQIA